MRVEILGPVRVRRGGIDCDLGPPRQRAVFGLLALACGQPLSRAELVSALWGDAPPPSAVNQIQAYVKDLRRALEPHRQPRSPSTILSSVGDGYALQAPAVDIDLMLFRRLVGAAASAQREGDPARAAQVWGEALGLWRAPPLADVAFLASHPKVVALTGEWRNAVAHYGDAMIAIGAAGDALPALVEAADAQPLDELAQARLIRAYRAAGQRGQAFTTYHAVRRRLADELGIGPGPELAAALTATLHDDPPAAVLPANPPAVPPANPPANPPAAVPPANPPAVAAHHTAPAGPRGVPDPATPAWPVSAWPVPAWSVSAWSVPAWSVSAWSVPAWSVSAWSVPAQLPPDVAVFAGRDGQLRQLNRLLPDPDDCRPAAPVISVVEGTAGIGKTTLAVHWAHRVTDRFPDGQLYVNLRGFAPSGPAMSPAEAVRGFLEALGVPPQRLPVNLGAQVGLYRSLLAGRRVLVVLDNARDAEQVRPLLPGSPGCLTVITSRIQLTGLVATDGAHPLALDLLSAADATELLTRRLGTGRVAAEPGAVDEIVTRCAGLPLALSVVAARAATRPDFALEVLASELRTAQGGLQAFASGDAATDVRAVFSWSYQALSSAAARLFRLLTCHPGPDIAAPAAASLAGAPAGRVLPLLAELTRAHLFSERVPGRYEFHDLLRSYATELAYAVDTTGERRAALHRMLDHYLHTAYRAARLLNPHRNPITPARSLPQTAPEDLAGYRQARSWLATERPVLLTAVRQAASAGFDRHAWQLPWALVDFLDTHGHWYDQVAVQHTALDAAARLADRLTQAHTHRVLARAYARLHRFDDAHAHARQAIDLSGELGDLAGRADAHRTLGWLLGRQHRHREALAHQQRALKLYRATGHQAGQAIALNSVGWNHAQLGRHRPALVYCQQALARMIALGDRHGEAVTWDSVGYILHHLGHHRRAARCYRHALTLYREIGDRYYEAETLTHLGDTHRVTGRPGAARVVWRRAVTILDELGHPDANQVRDRLRATAATPAGAGEAVARSAGGPGHPVEV